MSSAVATWSYAPTNRATCKGSCKQKIEKGSLRLGTPLEISGHESFLYRCLACVTAKQISNMREKYNSLEEMSGFSELKPEDQAAVLAQEGVAQKAAADAEAAKQAEKEAKAAAKKKAIADAKAAKAAAKAAEDTPAKRARTS
mmetsp:Transcript_3955/g.8045  ORF Transcript_3955/g.8045 Transcript_3955/m.8045 type:complete len:143 (+) Transcript_3955:33-461(+)